MKVAGTAAAITTAVSACAKVYRKVKSGTKLSDFTADDGKFCTPFGKRPQAAAGCGTGKGTSAGTSGRCIGSD